MQDLAVSVTAKAEVSTFDGQAPSPAMTGPAQVGTDFACFRHLVCSYLGILAWNSF